VSSSKLDTPANPRQLRSPARALVVMDQRVLAGAVGLALAHGKFLTRTARTEAEALDVINQWQPHLAIIDIDFGDGLILEQLGHAASDAERVPAVALTRRSDLKTKLAAFDAGADDILTVPFSPEELVARVLVIMRRTYRETAPFTRVIPIGELEIDILNRHVRAGTSELHLTSLEQSLLYLLAANAGQVVTREQIMDNLWGVDYAAESNVVDRHVRNLRAKLQNGWRRPRFIATVPGQEYRFVPTSTEDAEAPTPP